MCVSKLISFYLYLTLFYKYIFIFSISFRVLFNCCYINVNILFIQLFIPIELDSLCLIYIEAEEGVADT